MGKYDRTVGQEGQDTGTARPTVAPSGAAAAVFFFFFFFAQANDTRTRHVT